MKIKFIIGAAAMSFVLLFGANSLVSAKPHFPNFFHKNKTAKDTKKKVTMEQAQEIALKRVPGTVENSRTETQKGKTVYAFEIRDKKGMTENVWVSETGKIAKVEKQKAMKPAKSKTSKST